jgi:hypothetical protein
LFCLGVFCAVVGIANAEVGQQLHAKRPGNSSFIDDIATELPPHLRVTFALTELFHDVVSGDGVQVKAFVKWDPHSTAATEEDLGPGHIPPSYVPGPEQLKNYAFYGVLVMYDGLVLEGCGNTPVFPISFHSWIEEESEEGAVIGEFSATDNSTIQPNGFWTFAYTIRATDSHGGVSDYKFRGTVSALCTNLDSLD